MHYLYRTTSLFEVLCIVYALWWAYDTRHMTTTTTHATYAISIPPIHTLTPLMMVVGAVLVLWVLASLVLKVYVLWRAARRGDMWWFIALCFINTLGILELIYLALHRNPEPPAQSWS